MFYSMNAFLSVLFGNLSTGLSSGMKSIDRFVAKYLIDIVWFLEGKRIQVI